MKPIASFLETVHPAALTPETSNYLAMIILEQPEEGLLHELSRLQPHSTYKIAVFERSSSDTIEQYIDLAREINAPPIFLQPKAPTLKELTAGSPSLSVNLISPGSAGGSNDDLAAQLVAHHKTANLSWIGYQTYLTSPDLLAQLQARYFSSLRLGSYRENFKAAEPLIRSNSLNLIDFTAIRHCDAPECAGNGPNGLYAEEICQLARYIGVSSRLYACFLYGYPKKIKSSQMITSLIAQTLWHLFDSLSTAQNEDPYSPEHQRLFTTKEVYIGDHDHILYFLHSDQTGRWWIRFEDPEGGYHYFPCMYEEYAMSLKGELPFTWLRHYQKINRE